MRAVTPEEVDQIAGGITKRMPAAMRPMVIKKPSSWSSSVHVSAPAPPPEAPPPPASSGGGGGGGSGAPASSSPGELVDADVSFLQFGVNLMTADGKPNYYLKQIFSHEANSATEFDSNEHATTNGHVTISYGVEMGSVSLAELEGLKADGDISQSLYNELNYLRTHTGNEANTYLEQHPFTSADSAGLTKLAEVVYGADMWQLEEKLLPDSNYSFQLSDLPTPIEAAITDATIRYGANGIVSNNDIPGLWSDITNRNWSGVALDFAEQSSNTSGGNQSRFAEDYDWVQGEVDAGFVNGSR